MGVPTSFRFPVFSVSVVTVFFFFVFFLDASCPSLARRLPGDGDGGNSYDLPKPLQRRRARHLLQSSPEQSKPDCGAALQSIQFASLRSSCNESEMTLQGCCTPLVTIFASWISRTSWMSDSCTLSLLDFVSKQGVNPIALMIFCRASFAPPPSSRNEDTNAQRWIQLSSSLHSAASTSVSSGNNYDSSRYPDHTSYVSGPPLSPYWRHDPDDYGDYDLSPPSFAPGSVVSPNSDASPSSDASSLHTIFVSRPPSSPYWRHNPDDYNDYGENPRGAAPDSYASPDSDASPDASDASPSSDASSLHASYWRHNPDDYNDYAAPASRDSDASPSSRNEMVNEWDSYYAAIPSSEYSDGSLY